MDSADTPQQPFAALGGTAIADLADALQDTALLIVNKNTANLALLPRFAQVTALAAREIPVAVMEAALPRMRRLATLDIYGTRMASLAPLAHLPLASLRLSWAHAISDLAPLATLDRLETLSIGDMKRASDFAPLGGCQSLKSLHLASGMWSAQKIDSLAFLRKLTRLESLAIENVTMGDKDLTPICALTQLRQLHLPLRFPLREYARMSVCLPDTACKAFASHVSYTVTTMKPDGSVSEPEEHIVLVGKGGKGFARKDPDCEAAIAARGAEFEAWRAYYRNVPDPAADRREKLR